jgi:DNA-nicking Smr family endonuclease
VSRKADKRNRKRSLMDLALRMYPPDPEGEGFIKDAEHEEPVGGRSIPRSAGKMPVQARLDLHGYTRDEALAETERFIRRCLQQGARKILIIHGKGGSSQNDGVLRKVVRRYIETHPRVGETGIPDRKDGGSGATWAILRYRSR